MNEVKSDRTIHTVTFFELIAYADFLASLPSKEIK